MTLLCSISINTTMISITQKFVQSNKASSFDIICDFFCFFLNLKISFWSGL